MKGNIQSVVNLLRSSASGLIGLASARCREFPERGSLLVSMKNNGRSILCIFFAVFFIQVSAIEAQSRPEETFSIFQNFINGQVPIKEAVVYRKILNTNGAILNQDWWRFGYQSDTWYLERLVPDKDDSSKLVSRPNGNICGTSYRSVWTVSDKDIHTAAKSSASGSVPESFTKFYCNLMISTLSLGVPRRLDVLTIDEAPIEMHASEFTSTVGTKFDKKGTIIEARPIDGTWKANADGLPVSLQYPGIGEFSGGSVDYEYSSSTTRLPTVFTIKRTKDVLRYEFLSLSLGTNDLVTTNGYVPSLFATATGTNFQRHITVWTNSLAYSLTNGKLRPAFGADRKKNGTFIMVILALASATFLTLWYRRSK